MPHVYKQKRPSGPLSQHKRKGRYRGKGVRSEAFRRREKNRVYLPAERKALRYRRGFTLADVAAKDI